MASIEDGNVGSGYEAPDDEDDIIEEALELYQQCIDGWNEVRNEGLDDLRFARLAEQWPADIKQQRLYEKRPCLTINMMPTFIRQVVNDARQNKPQIKVRPVGSGADPQTAKIYSGIIKNIESTSDADVAYDTAATCAVQNGFGFYRIGLDYAHDDTFDMDLKFHTIENPFSVIFDPNTEAYDSSDWDVCFVMSQIPRKDFEKQYPGVDLASWGQDDKIRPWFNDDFVMQADYYRREESQKIIVQLSNGDVVDKEQLDDPDFANLIQMIGATPTRQRPVKTHKVFHRVITAKNILNESVWPGTIIPVVPVYGDAFNVEGRRYFRSLIHEAKDSQKMFNFWRTMTTELVALAPKMPWVGPEQAFLGEDAEKWTQANVKNYPYLSYAGQIPPQRGEPNPIPAGAMNEASLAAEDMKQIIGMNNPSLGIPDNTVISGRAKRMERHESDTATFHFADNLNRSVRCGGRILLEAIPKVYNSARIIRILGDDNKPAMAAIGPAQVNGVPNPPPQGLDRIYDLTQGKYDLVVDAGPSYTTRREESAETMTAFIQAFPQAAPLLGDMIAKLQDWPDAEKISERMQTMLPPAIQAKEAGQPPPPPQPPPEVQAKMAEAQADIQIAQQKATNDAQLERQKSQARIQLEAVQAQNDMAVMQQKATLEAQIARDKATLQADLERQKVTLEMEMTKQREAAKTAIELHRYKNYPKPQKANGPAH